MAIFKKYGHQWGQCFQEEIDLFENCHINAILAQGLKLCLWRKIGPSLRSCLTAMDVSDDIEVGMVKSYITESKLFAYDSASEKA